MSSILAQANPYVATLVYALQDNLRWVNAPASGSIHDMSFDATTTVLSSTAAQAFVGSVVKVAGAGVPLSAVQIDITVVGDLTQLVYLKQLVALKFPTAVVPVKVHGLVTEGGLHGTLVAVSKGGTSQTIHW